MREYLISAARHIAGAAVGALTAFAASQGFDVFNPEMVADIREGVEAFVMGVGLVAYALVEKALKPVLSRLFGSAGL